MTKKQMEEKIAALEQKLSDLQGQLVQLAMQHRPAIIFTPTPSPTYVPTIPIDPILPYRVGDFPPFGGNVMCSSNQ